MSRRNFLKQMAISSISLISPSLFASLPNKYSKAVLIGKGKPKLYGKNYRLQKEAYLALETMKKEALTKNVKIHVVSSYRDFNHQNRLWLKKYKKYSALGYSKIKIINKIKEYSAIPGTSRHHWGTDVDLIDYDKKFSNNPLNNKKNKQNSFRNWMDGNAHKYGFYLVYTDNKFREGYNYESWHYTYHKLSKPMLKAYLDLDITSVLKKEKIAGNTLFSKKFIDDYIQEHVLGINDYLF